MIRNKKPVIIVEVMAVIAMLSLTMTFHIFAPLLLLYILLRLTLIIPLERYGIITRFLVVLLSVVSFNTLIGFFAWIVKIPVSTNLLIFLYSLVVIILLLISKNPKKLNDFGIVIQRREIFALAISILLFIVTIAPLFVKHNGIQVARVISTGGDNISHINIFKGVEAQRGYVQRKFSDPKEFIKASFVPYPQGWHLNIYVAKSSIESFTGNFSLDKLLLFYYVISSLGLVILLYLFTIIGLTLQESLKDYSRVARYLSVGFTASILFTGPFFALFMLGFQTQIFALVLLLAELLLLLYIVYERRGPVRKQLFCLSLIFASSVSFVWLFLWPLAIGAAVLAALEIFRPNISKVLVHWKSSLLVLFLGSVGTGQIMFQLLYPPPLTVIGANGYILEPNNILLLSMLSVLSLYVVYMHEYRHIRLLGQITGASAIFSLVVLAYQLYSVDGPRYFYYKSTYTFILLGFLLLTCAIGMIFTNVLHKIGTTYRSMVLLTLGFSLAISSMAWSVSSDYFRRYIMLKPYGMSEELVDAVLSIVKADSNNGHKIVAIGSCNREQDIKAMQYAVALTNDHDIEQKGIVYAQIDFSKKLKTFEAIKTQLETEPNIFVISTDKILQNNLIEFLGEDIKKVKFVDIDYGDKPKTTVDCPNLLH